MTTYYDCLPLNEEEDHRRAQYHRHERQHVHLAHVVHPQLEHEVGALDAFQVVRCSVVIVARLIRLFDVYRTHIDEPSEIGRR